MGMVCGGCFTTDRSQTEYLWRPEYDQADSDMLGVALEMDVDWWPSTGEVRVSSCEDYSVVEPHNGTFEDKARALRLARLKVAAEVGKRMEEEGLRKIKRLYGF